MTYATLVFGRVKVDVVTMSSDGLERELDREQAREYYDRELRASWDEFQRENGAQRDKAKALVNSVKVRTYEEALREWRSKPRRFGFAPPQPDPFDEVIIDGITHRVDQGSAQEFLQAEAARRYPHPSEPEKPPDFETWFGVRKKEKRTWAAEFITGEAVMTIDLGDKLDWSWGFPSSAAIRELNRLEREGWMLVHVSEDHGLYQGADAADEAYLTRVRYLLHSEQR